MPQDKLRQLRDKIDRVDDQVLALLNERARAVRKIGAEKARRKEEVYAANREQQILERLSAANKGPLPPDALEEIFRAVINNCRLLQKPLVIAYFGPEATFTHQAALKQFGRAAEYNPMKTIADVFDEVEKGRADHGVVPIENSTEGVVNHTLDMFMESDLTICAERQDPICQCLLSSQDSLKKVKGVYSYGNALGQCRRWLDAHLRGVPVHEAASTADAAAHAALHPDAAAIASPLAAEIYHLKILANNIQDARDNRTRFLVIGRKMPGSTGRDKTSLLLSIKDRVGALHELLSVFKNARINLTKVESRPTKKKAWEYVFFVDLNGHVSEPAVKKALEDIAEHCAFVKVLGLTPAVIELMAPEKPALQARREVGCFEPYLPGRSLEQVKKHYGLKKVIKLASNENPLGASPRALAAARKAVALSHLYPDGFSTDLRAAAARHAGVPEKNVALGAGSDELIELLGRAYLTPDDEIVVSEHAFTRYRMAADIMGAKTVAAPMRGLTHDLAAMARAVTPRTKLVFVANPNNPTGTYNAAAEVAALLDALPPAALLVLDEAYFEYAREKKDYADGISFFKKGRNLMVLRTFSKAYGLAGLRLGWGVGPAQVVDALERIRPPFNVNVAAQAAGVAALADGAHVRRVVRLLSSETRKMETALGAMGLEWTPSAANFLMLKVAPRRGKDVFEALLRKGVIVRSLDEYGLLDRIRVTVGLPAENRLFLKALEETLS